MSTYTEKLEAIFWDLDINKNEEVNGFVPSFELVKLLTFEETELMQELERNPFLKTIFHLNKTKEKCFVETEERQWETESNPDISSDSENETSFVSNFRMNQRTSKEETNQECPNRNEASTSLGKRKKPEGFEWTKDTTKTTGHQGGSIFTLNIDCKTVTPQNFQNIDFLIFVQNGSKSYYKHVYIVYLIIV